jgi:O-antigen ligase
MACLPSKPFQEPGIATLTHRYGAPAYLLLCLVLGGASGAGILANALLQLAALLVLTVSGGQTPRPYPFAARALIGLILLAAAMTIAQIVPLPPTVWSLLPGKGGVVHVFQLAAAGPAWLPVSMTPDATIAALLSLLPAGAMILGTLAASGRGRGLAIDVLIGGAALSGLLGFAQILGDPDSGLYPYAITNRGSAVGFFANRNHFGTLLLCALPFLTIRLLPDDERQSVGRWLLMALLAAAILGGIAIDGSVAATLMLPPVLLACAALLWRDKAATMTRAVRIGGGIVIGSLLGVTLLVATLRLQPAEPDASPQHRSAIIPTTLRAAADHLPFGSGGGSFTQVYPGYEDPQAASLEYINHAHDDYAEVLLDYGIPGALLVAGTLLLWVVRAHALWRKGAPDDAEGRAAIVALAVVIAHSVVDYPLRTSAIAAVTALSAALAAAPRRAPESKTNRPTSARKKARPGSLSVMASDL